MRPGPPLSAQTGGMGNVDGQDASTRRFPPRPDSVRAARRFVRTALEGTPDPVVDTAELLLGELATNAVLHAGTEFEVSVSATDGRVRVQVGDRQPDRPPLPPGTCAGAGTGLGLVMVEELASRYGVRSGEEHKTVWFDLGDGPAPWAPSTWESARPPSGPHTTVALVDLPHALYTACRMRRHALLRELALATPPGRAAGVSTRDALTAHETSTRVTAWLAAALETQQPASDIRSVRIAVPSDAAPAVDTLRRVLERTEEAARDGRLLARPSFTHHRDFHTWLFDQIVRQLDGEDPTAWTVVPREPGATPAQLAPWEAGQVRDSRTPTIAADEDNRIIAANDAAADMLGWYAEELVGQRLTVLIPQHLWGRHLAAFGSLLLTGMPRIMGRSVPLPAQHRDGELVPVRLLIQPQETAEGETVFVAQLTPRAATPYSHAPERKRAPFPQEPAGVPAREPVSASTGGDEDAYKLERLALLADTRSALSGTADLREGLRRVCLVLTQRLADWCVLDLVDEHGRVERACVVHRDPQRVPFDIRTGALPSVSEEAQGALARVLRGAGPLLLTDASEAGPARNALDARHLELIQRMGANSAVVAPLRARQEIMGAVTVARTGGAEPFTGEDLPLVDDLVRNLALGVDNVRLYQTTQDIAERLQHSLLPVLPDVPHLRMAARYAPSSATAQVGGDWYDSFVVPNGSTALVIGDVAGHDLEAAIAMSQLRSMLRGIAIDRQEPPETVLRRLDTAHHSLYQEATATCVYAVVKGPAEGTWELKHSSAGHLPPLLTTYEGETRYLEDGAGLLLGVDPGAPRPGARDLVPADATVLLYTDGLIERRGGSLDDGMELLREHTADLARESLDVFCDELLLRLGADNADDIAVLAVRPVPPS